MTRRFATYVTCTRCGANHTAESAFQRWVRENPELDSSDGHVVSDFDFFVHRFMTPTAGRAIQAVMFLEVKTKWAEMRISQRKSLSIARQLIQNRRGLERLHEVTDGIRGPTIRVWNFGGFELRFSGESPTDSDRITWSGKKISAETLEMLLRFDIDPQTLRPIDWRANHHRPEQTIPLNFH